MIINTLHLKLAFQPHLAKVPIPSLDGVDRAVRNMMVALWGNFVEFADPTPPGSFLNWSEHCFLLHD